MNWLFWRKKSKEEENLLKLEAGYRSAEASVEQINQRAHQLTRESVSYKHEAEELNRVAKVMYRAGMAQKDRGAVGTYAKIVSGVTKQKELMEKRATLAEMRALSYRAYRIMAEQQKETLEHYLQSVKSGRITVSAEELEKVLRDNEKLLREYQKPEDMWRIKNLMADMTRAEEKAIEAELRADLELSDVVDAELETLRATESAPEVKGLVEKWAQLREPVKVGASS